MKTYIQIRNSCLGVFHIFTKSDLAKFNYFPVVMPDLYLNRIEHPERFSGEFMLVISEEPLYLIKKRMDMYIEHFDSGEWETETSSIYPVLAFILSYPKTEERFQQYVSRALENAGIDDLNVITTSNRAMFNQRDSQNKIWCAVDKPEELLTLNNILVNP